MFPRLDIEIMYEAVQTSPVFSPRRLRRDEDHAGPRVVRERRNGGRNKREDVRREAVRRSELRTRKQEARVREKNNRRVIARTAKLDDVERRITQSARFQHPRHRTTGYRFIENIQGLMPPAVTLCSSPARQREHHRRTLSSRTSSSSSSASLFLGLLACPRT